jgi:hypothetical protein
MTVTWLCTGYPSAAQEYPSESVEACKTFVVDCMDRCGPVNVDDFPDNRHREAIVFVNTWPCSHIEPGFGCGDSIPCTSSGNFITIPSPGIPFSLSPNS